MLVTSRSGGGKTTLCNTLQEMGIAAFDADRVTNLAGWIDLETKRPTHVDYAKPIDKRKVGWLWNEEVIGNLLSEYPQVVLCGSADNQLQFYGLFHKVIFLSLPADEHVRRIQNRTQNDYGKAPFMAQQIVEEQAELLAQSQKLGAIIMNANRPIKAVALDIIRHVK